MESCLGPQQMPLDYWAALSPERIALVSGQHGYNWRQMQQRVRELADHWSEAGVSKVDCLVLLGKNHPDMLWCFLAAIQSGVKVAFVAPGPVNKITDKLETLTVPGQTLWIYSPDESLHRDCQPLLSSIIRWLPLASCDFPVVILAANVADKAVNKHTQNAYQQNNLATLTFTSGSMGNPKAVAHTHRQHFASARGLLAQFTYQPGDTWLLSLPLYHVSGLAILYRWLLSGACLKIGSGDVPADISDVTHASLVPVQLQRLLDSQQPIGLTHVLLGGSHIPLKLCQQACQRGIETWLGYGMTEAASTVTAKRFDGLPGAGYLLAARKLKIEQQRIYIGGETLALGYYHQGCVTPLTEADGWFDSKDVGYWRDKQLIVEGRADNMFISGGENIHCEEIETVLNRHPQIEIAMVVPVDDPEYGQRAVAVIRSYNTMPEQEEIENWLPDQLEKYKWPKCYLPLPEHLLGQGIKLPRSVIKDWVNQALNHSVMR